MKQIACALVALSILAAGCASRSSEREPAPVTEGRKYGYDIAVELGLAQSMMGQEMSMHLAGDGSAELTAIAVAPEQIRWSFSLPRIHARMNDLMNPTRMIDTTFTMDPIPLTSTAAGTVVDVSSPADQDNSMMRMLVNRAVTGILLPQLFAPASIGSAQPGTTWSTDLRDTVGEENMGLRMITSSTATYTVEGLVDTLGMRAARVTMRTGGTKIAGAMKFQGINLSLAGDGTSLATLYYALSDGLLLSGSGETTNRMRATLAGGARMEIPITQTLTLRAARTP